MHARHTVYTISPSPDATLAVEIRLTGLSKQKRLFVFERFAGKLIYDVQDPLTSVLTLDVEAASLLRRDTKPRERSTKLARCTVLEAEHYPRLQITLQRFVAKPLRGFIAEGHLFFRGSERAVKWNVGFGEEKNGRLQIDADAIVRLSELGIVCPASFFGLVKMQDEAVLHALLWGTAEKPALPAI